MQLFKARKLIGMGLAFSMLATVHARADEEMGQETVPAGEADDIASITKTIQQGVQKQFEEDKKAHDAAVAHRDAHAKHHGCVKSEFVVSENIPPNYQYGVFSKPGKAYQALIRYSNGSGEIKKDSDGDARGMAIKLLDIPGTKILESEKNETTQDFVMINYPVFFIRNVHDYIGFTEATASKSAIKLLAFFLNPFDSHLTELSIANKITSQKVTNPLTPAYYSMTPYKLGTKDASPAIKFSASPCQGQSITQVGSPDSADSLREAMKATLSQQDVCFDFKIQLQTDPANMPVEDPTVQWSENTSGFVKVAEIHIPKQSFDSAEQLESCENVSMTPWHSLPEHQPLGGVNRARKAVYSAVSELRHKLNSAPRVEPVAN